MKRIIYILIFLTLIAATKAQSYLNVLITKNEVFQFSLIGTEITFSSEGDMVITKSDLSTVLFPFANVTELTFSNIPLSIEKTNSVSKLKFYIKDKYLFIQNEQGIKIESVIVYDILGKAKISIAKFDDTKIDISSLNKGVYVVKAGTDSFKFMI